MNELSLFSGYGGTSIGLKLALGEVRTIGYVEIEKYCQEIIRARVKDGYLDDAPVFGDIKQFNDQDWPEKYRGLVDIVTGGFPCQDISHGGKKRGIKYGTRSGLWFEMLRTISTIRPRYVLLENVSAILSNGADIVLGSLSEIGYDAEWHIVSASDAGAPHLRKRWWCWGGDRTQVENTTGT
tara:strand:+ start:195 stop:740 length:546 start_codon:yes stop_codon:yes gene_type:complete